MLMSGGRDLLGLIDAAVPVLTPRTFLGRLEASQAGSLRERITMPVSFTRDLRKHLSAQRSGVDGLPWIHRGGVSPGGLS